jgi:hypothetical protein
MESEINSTHAILLALDLSRPVRYSSERVIAMT